MDHFLPLLLPGLDFHTLLGCGACLGPQHPLISRGLLKVGDGVMFWGKGSQGLLLCLLIACLGRSLSGCNSQNLVLCRWVQEFLNEENRGLDVLLEYLAFAQCSVA